MEEERCDFRERKGFQAREMESEVCFSSNGCVWRVWLRWTWTARLTSLNFVEFWYKK